MLEFQNVSYQYPSEDFDIIDHLSFAVEPGSFHCIIGISGCGKSTIFRMTNGLLKPKAGTILVEGKSIVGRKHYCGYMPQKDLLFPWRTVGENVALPLEIQGALTRAERRDRAAAALAGTHDFKAFCASGSEVKSTVRTLYRIEIKKEGSDIYFDFFGNGFLYNMVRILVGTLVYVGQGRISAGQVGEILRSTDRRLAGITAPPYGLYMVSVRYARRYIAMLRPRPWPSGRGGCHMPPVSKMKKHQLTHACHNQARVFALKNGKIHAMDFKTKPGESSNNA